MQTRFALDFEWVGFELHPEIPAGGLDLSTMFPPDRVAAMRDHLLEVADRLGVPIAFSDRAPSTKPALVLAELARARGVLPAFRDATMDAYWRDGRDIEARDTLVELAGRAAIPADTALAALDDPGAPALLEAQRREAAMWGVTGIPTWFMLPTGFDPEGPPPPEDGPQAVKVVGCQPLEVVERAARMAGAQPRGG